MKKIYYIMKLITLVISAVKHVLIKYEIIVMKLVNIEDQHVEYVIRGTDNKTSFL